MRIIAIKNLVKYYNNVKAVDDISFNVEKGDFFAFLGPNGAGKSTVINIIATLLEKTSGEVFVCGHLLGKEDNAIRSKLGIVFQSSTLDNLLTVRENLKVRGSFYKLNKEELNIRINEIVNLLKMESYIDRRYGTLSGGQRRMSDIARGLINNPEVLILDEPTTGLDPKSRKLIWSVISKLREQRRITIFLTTHYMEETNIADKVVIINKGKILATGTPDELKMKYSYDILRIMPKDKSFVNNLKKDNIKYKVDRDVIRIKINSSFEGIDVVSKYKKYISNFEILIGDMDDVFLNITGTGLEGEE